MKPAEFDENIRKNVWEIPLGSTVDRYRPDYQRAYFTISRLASTAHAYLSKSDVVAAMAELKEAIAVIEMAELAWVIVSQPPADKP